jgi:hypothetical protein
MNEHELGKTLVGINGGNDRAMAERVIRRQRWFTHGLAGVTLIIWTLAGAMVVTLYALVITYVLPSIQIAAVKQDPQHQQKMLEVILYFGLYIGWPMAIASAVLLVLAAICTVLLVYWSRRATLRLVDQRLEQILTELRRPQEG